MKLIADLGVLKPKETSNYKVRYGMYECPNCLKHFKVMTQSVKSGKSTQCNSCSSRKASTTHGRSKTKNFYRWENMKQRCRNENAPNYAYYGGRGITMPDSWYENFVLYDDYVNSLPNSGKEGYTIDRIDTDGNYEEGNLRWASKTVQARNTRNTKISKSGVNGVSWDSRREKWYSSITVGYKMINLGRYLCLGEAIKARKQAEIKYKFKEEI